MSMNYILAKTGHCILDRKADSRTRVVISRDAYFAGHASRQIEHMACFEQ